jgi:hypothetical protein
LKAKLVEVRSEELVVGFVLLSVPSIADAGCGVPRNSKFKDGNILIFHNTDVRPGRSAD